MDETRSQPESDNTEKSNARDSLELSQRPICILMITPTAIGKNETSNEVEIGTENDDDDLSNINPAKLEEQPSLEEIINSFHDFKVTLEKSGSNDFHVFSQKLNRIFTSTDKSLTFNMAMNPHTPLLVRIMLVCSNQIFQPLSRCSYHIRGDNTTFRDHVVTHRDSAARYVGTANRIYQRERLAILVPIEEIGQKSISLEFKCLSSCYKIRKIATALVFTLEDENSNSVLGRQIFNVHVSKNYIRDMEVAERNGPHKRNLSKLFQDEAAGPSTGRDALIDLSELKLLLPPEMAGEFLEVNRQFFKAKLYSAQDDAIKNSLKLCLEKVDKVMCNFSNKRKLKDNTDVI
ncbi:uncharacterized protein LOC120423592 [Culex pipiens pallens]|uniref:uncharacterized protein LOC120423592 n=1 Tax=Culex pipiens pallens TaxID=42434 RepID=UPI001952D3A5|nr:uncharacterized protein LOC120423592 [Culex pipiens pallens]